MTVKYSESRFYSSLVGYIMSGSWASCGQITVQRLHIVRVTIGCTLLPSKRQPIIIIIVHLCTVSGWSDIHCTIFNHLRDSFDTRVIWESDQVSVLSSVLFHAACRGTEGRLSAPSEQNDSDRVIIWIYDMFGKLQPADSGSRTVLQAIRESICAGPSAL